MKVEQLKALVLGGNAATEGQQKKDTTPDTLAAIKEAIDGLRSDFKSGALTANVYLDSQKLDSGMGRRMMFTGALT